MSLGFSLTRFARKLFLVCILTAVCIPTTSFAFPLGALRYVPYLFEVPVVKEVTKTFAQSLIKSLPQEYQKYQKYIPSITESSYCSINPAICGLKKALPVLSEAKDVFLQSRLKESLGDLAQSIGEVKSLMSAGMALQTAMITYAIAAEGEKTRAEIRQSKEDNARRHEELKDYLKDASRRLHHELGEMKALHLAELNAKYHQAYQCSGKISPTSDPSRISYCIGVIEEIRNRLTYLSLGQFEILKLYELEVVLTNYYPRPEIKAYQQLLRSIQETPLDKDIDDALQEGFCLRFKDDISFNPDVFKKTKHCKSEGSWLREGLHKSWQKMRQRHFLSSSPIKNSLQLEKEINLKKNLVSLLSKRLGKEPVINASVVYEKAQQIAQLRLREWEEDLRDNERDSVLFTLKYKVVGEKYSNLRVHSSQSFTHSSTPSTYNKPHGWTVFVEHKSNADQEIMFDQTKDGFFTFNISTGGLFGSRVTCTFKLNDILIDSVKTNPTAIGYLPCTDTSFRIRYSLSSSFPS